MIDSFNLFISIPYSADVQSVLTITVCLLEWSSDWRTVLNWRSMAFHSLLILLVCSTVWPTTFVVSTSANDVVALQGLLREWQGTPLDNWSLNEDADPCGAQWQGVVCSPSLSVVNLRLNGARLSGGIPTAIGDLEELQVLDLSGNTMLTSTIPEQIGHLRRLTHLKLSGCNFTGKVPQEIYNLNNLKYLDLSNNPYLSVDLNAQPLISLRKEAEPLYSSRRHLLHHRSLLQKSSSNGSSRRNLPVFYTYIGIGCVGAVFVVIFTFCCCRYMSVRRTRNDIFLTTPGAPGLTTFQSKPSRSIHIFNKNSEMDDRH